MTQPARNAKPFVIPIFIPHAGCPHRCVFCDQTRTTGQREPFPSRVDIHATIRRFLSYRRQRDRRTEISFYGGNFLGIPTARRAALLALGSEYVSAGVVDGLRFSTRPDTITNISLQSIADFPVSTIELGVQSMNDKVLDACHRGHTASDTRRAVTLLRMKSYRLGLQMMVGLPADTPQYALETGREIAALGPDFVRIYPTLVLQGSTLHRWLAQGRYTPLALDESVDLVKKLFALFTSNHIQVIRMGLQPTEDLNAADGVAAGPFHPAFGELVHSALWRSALQKGLARRIDAHAPLEIALHPSLVSRVRGFKNENYLWIQHEFKPTGLYIRTSPDLPLDQVLINGAACPLIADEDQIRTTA
jgi:histone acetyltransferase (RNA polymerase elongator complex component)